MRRRRAYNANIPLSTWEVDQIHKNYPGLQIETVVKQLIGAAIGSQPPARQLEPKSKPVRPATSCSGFGEGIELAADTSE